MSATATAISEDQSRHRLAAAIYRLLHDLRPFIRAYAATEEEQKNLPELKIDFVGGVGDDAGSTILRAIKSHPAMWKGAIPDECCIVPRKVLVDQVGTDVADYMARHGAALVENYAARSLHARERS